MSDLTPKYPQGTPEYDEYATKLRKALAEATPEDWDAVLGDPFADTGLTPGTVFSSDYHGYRI